MSKKYKDKICVYCASENSETADHIFPRNLFLVDKRSNLPKVPACKRCNNEKSKLEHYLASVLPFGGRHEDAKSNLEIMVPKRLSKNKKLHQNINSELSYIWAEDDSGLFLRHLTIPLNFTKIEQLFEYIVRALTWYHWSVLLKAKDFVKVLALTKFGEEYFQKRLFGVNVNAHISENLGEGTIVYEGVQGVDNPKITAWRFKVYGGFTMSGDQNSQNERASIIGIVTGGKKYKI